MPVNTSPDQNSTRPAVSDHFDGREFHNLDGVPAGSSFIDLLRWKFLGKARTPWPEHPEPDSREPALPTTLPPGEMAATFVGHSTFLLQFGGGLNILTDPVWSGRVGPVSFAGPGRARPPALDFAALPPIAVVLLTHGHYDHLDLPTLRRLEERFHPLFLAGLGQKSFLQKCGLPQVEELDWWQSLSLPFPGTELEATFTPAQHWSMRNPFVRNQSLWGGFWLRQGSLNVYFAGDTGLGRHFAVIRARLGEAAVSFLPIGAYEPRWFMREQHMNPDDAVEAHLALGTRKSIGMHFGTFQLTDEGIDEPARALAASLRTHGVPPEYFHVPAFGETLRL